jgi:ribose 5-phosphate isomerase A
VSAARSAAEKRAAAEVAASLVESKMTIGLGTGSTVVELLPLLAARGLDVRCVATSPATENAALALGLAVEPFDAIDRLDLAVDGADQVDPHGRLVKGGGGAHTREKIAAAAADRFVVIVSSDKLVDELRAPVPLELSSFGLRSTLRAVAPARVRGAAQSPDGGVIADYIGSVEDPARLAQRFEATPGVIEHGLFEPELVDEILVAHGEIVEPLRRKKA